ncbi:MAG: ParB/RepB/Spo0J family partition protein [bacterium]|nr:ParB/RepB/Spo0J family partition protein [bacterium]
MSEFLFPPEYDHQHLYPISVDDLHPDPNQPRKHFDEKSLKSLAQSIKTKGVLQPVIFRLEGEKKILIAGERRLRAAKMAGLSKIPAIYWDQGRAAELSLIENLVRENLNPIEEAEALARMQQEYDYSLEELSKILGKAKSTLSETIKINDLIPAIKDACREDNRWPRRVLLEIAKQPTEEAQMRLFQKACDSGLTSDQIRLLTRSRGKNRKRVAIFMEHIGKVSKYVDKVDVSGIETKERGKLRKQVEQLRERMDALLESLQQEA